MKRILVGVDGSKESRDAAKFAAGIARSTGAQLAVVSAVAGVSVIEGSPELVLRAADWVKRETAEATIIVKEIAGSIGEGLQVETVVAQGAPPVVLADLAKAADVELVVVGHRGRNSVARALLGSVADRLVQISPKPVLVFR